MNDITKLPHSFKRHTYKCVSPKAQPFLSYNVLLLRHVPCRRDMFRLLYFLKMLLFSKLLIAFWNLYNFITFLKKWLIVLDFASYFMKLVSILNHVSLYSCAHFHCLSFFLYLLSFFHFLLLRNKQEWNFFLNAYPSNFIQSMVIFFRFYYYKIRK